MNSTSNSTENPLGLSGDSHGSLYKLIGVSLAIASGKYIIYVTIVTNARQNN
jgi:hypothetical protein